MAYEPVTHPGLWRRTDQPMPGFVTSAQNALMVHHGNAYEEALEEQRRLGRRTGRAIEQDITAFRAMLAMSDDDVDLALLVALGTNRDLPEHTPAVARAWLEQYIADLEEILIETAPEREATRVAQAAEAAARGPDPDPTLSLAKGFLRSHFAVGSPYQEGLDHIERVLVRHGQQTREGTGAIRAILDRPEGEVDLVATVTETVGDDIAPEPTPEASRVWLERLLSDIDQLVVQADTDPS